jgi:hypothetical protein
MRDVMRDEKGRPTAKAERWRPLKRQVLICASLDRVMLAQLISVLVVLPAADEMLREHT